VREKPENRARMGVEAMALNDTINFNPTVDYFKLYNDENSTLSSALGENSSFANITDFHRTPSSPLYPSTSTPSPLSASTSPSSSAIPLVAATTLTITSTIINNYSSQNYSNYSDTNHSHNSSINSLNQSALYQFKSLSNASSDDNNNGNNSFASVNDSAKISYESGSNFMLLLEDFGEYFYNYNGSDFNSTISIYQANCSLSNSTCGDDAQRKLFSPFKLLVREAGLEAKFCGIRNYEP
jgi:hypothetical protein